MMLSHHCVTPRVLSIQSHVVSGYCGNKSATFPLQLLEFEVDIVNSVQLSNHTQYKTTKGQIFSSRDIEDLHTGLKENNLLQLYDVVLSGYVADASYIEAMSKLIGDVKDQRSKLGLGCWYTFDPVLGDDATGYYVPNGPKIANTYKDNLIPLADIITPNRFEAEILTGVQIDGSSNNAIEQAIEAIKILHQQGIRMVAITSFEVASKPGHLVCILSDDPAASRCASAEDNDKESQIWTLCIPKLDCPFTGTGDLFAALISAWLHKTNFNLKLSLENTANSIHEILEDTLEWSKKVEDNSVQSYELRLVQNKSKLLYPQARFKAERIETCLSQ